MTTTLRWVTAMLMALFSTAAFAAPVTFSTTGSTSTNGTYGVASGQFGASGSTLKMIASAWQINQMTGAITSAYLGAYSGGLGVTGIGDANGGSNLHTIDNLGGYTDLIMLQFSRPVVLAGINVNLYQLTGITGLHSDFAVARAASLAPPVWSNAVSLSGTNASAYSWTEQTGRTSSGSKTFTTLGGSRIWLISASQLTSDRNDGFKLASITVNEAPAVPEPATWAMLLMGFGLIGVTQRRRRGEPAAA